MGEGGVIKECQQEGVEGDGESSHIVGLVTVALGDKSRAQGGRDEDVAHVGYFGD